MEDGGRKPLDLQLESQLVEWIYDMRSNGLCASRNLIMAKAKYFTKVNMMKRRNLFTKDGNMKPPSRKRITEWVLGAWSQLPKENIIKSFNCCGLSLANNGTEDDFTHCLKQRQPCEAERQKLNSQLSILVDESDTVNSFISSSDEEDANRLSCVKEKSYINNTSNL